MSLINKMLADLEQRQSYFKDHDQIVLGGLAPVAETGFSSSRVPYNFLLICFFVVAMVLAVYAYLGSAPYTTVPLPEVIGETGMVPANTGSDQSVQQDIQMPDTQMLVTPAASVLELDMSLPSQAGIETAPAESVTQINDITISLDGGTTSIQLFLDHSTEFEVYTLENSDQVVLEIENALLQASIPAIAEHPYIESLRFSNSTGENFKLLIDSSMPVLIEDAELMAGTEGYVLFVSLRPSDTESIELVPVIKTDLPVAETNFGQMQVTPSTITTDMDFERSVVEARLLYSDKNFNKGDEKVLGILGQQPLNIQARLLYASAMISRGNINAAMQVLEAGLKLDPGISEWAKVYARLLVNQGLTDPAVEVLAKALPEISKDNEYHAFYAALLQQLARHDEAGKVYRELLAQYPGNGLWWMGLAISLDAMKSKEDALQAYNKALEGQALNYELSQYVHQQIERLSR